MNIDNATITDLDNELKKIRLHLRTYRRDYILGAVGLTAGLYFGKKFRKAPKVDVIVDTWLTEMKGKGFEVYALNKAQHDLWQSMVDYVFAVSNSTGKSVLDVAADLTRDYKIDAGYYLRK